MIGIEDLPGPIPAPVRRRVALLGSLPALFLGWALTGVVELLSRLVDWPEWWRYVARWFA